MTPVASIPVEPWQLRETALDLELEGLAHAESLFALSDGFLGLRGGLDEGHPRGLPGTYLNGLHEVAPLEYAERGYGYPTSEQRLVDVPNGTLVRLVVDGEPLDVRTGHLAGHERVLDLRDGVLTRRVEWTSPSGAGIRLTSRRVVSLVERGLASIEYEVEAVGRPVRLEVLSDLVANEPLPELEGGPEAGSSRQALLVAHGAEAWASGAHLAHAIPSSGWAVGAAMDHELECDAPLHASATALADRARFTVGASLEPGQRLRLVKHLGYVCGRSPAGLGARAAAVAARGRELGWEQVLDDQRGVLADYWVRADVQVDGDDELQQAIRFSLFHILQATARAEGVTAVPAKGLTGTGYDGHTFWDTETYLLPVLTHTTPDVAQALLRWRHSTLPQARARARELGLDGAAFPWRTIDGTENSGYWPAGTAAFHISADIADAVLRHVWATGDEEFARTAGLEVLVETARLWRSLGHEDAAGRFRIDGVTGPDEYSAVADNNVYTNLMAQQNLRGAADLAERHRAEAAGLGVDDAEVASWRRAADAVVVPYDERLGVHPQSDGFTDHAVWDFSAPGRAEYPLQEHWPYYELYRTQVVKQADLVLAMHRRPDAFTPEQKRRNVDYYEPITVRDSSLSAGTQAVLAADVGHLELAHDHAREAALIDLRDLRRSTDEGLHIASLGAAWAALVAGFGGMRDHGGQLRLAPRLPPRLERLQFRLARLGSLLQVVVTPAEATYSLVEGGPLDLEHHGHRFRLEPDVPCTFPIAPLAEQPRPTQPPGAGPRAPAGHPLG